MPRRFRTTITSVALPASKGPMPNSDRALLLGKALVPSWGSISLTEMGSAASFATPEPATPYPSTGPIRRGRAEATRSMRIVPARCTLRMVQKLTTSSSLTEARDSGCSTPGHLERARLSRERGRGSTISGVSRLAKNRHDAQNPPIGYQSMSTNETVLTPFAKSSSTASQSRSQQ